MVSLRPDDQPRMTKWCPVCNRRVLRAPTALPEELWREARAVCARVSGLGLTPCPLAGSSLSAALHLQTAAHLDGEHSCPEESTASRLLSENKVPRVPSLT